MKAMVELASVGFQGEQADQAGLDPEHMIDLGIGRLQQLATVEAQQRQWPQALQQGIGNLVHH